MLQLNENKQFAFFQRLAFPLRTDESPNDFGKNH